MKTPVSSSSVPVPLSGSLRLSVLVPSNLIPHMWSRPTPFPLCRGPNPMPSVPVSTWSRLSRCHSWSHLSRSHPVSSIPVPPLFPSVRVPPRSVFTGIYLSPTRRSWSYLFRSQARSRPSRSHHRSRFSRSHPGLVCTGHISGTVCSGPTPGLVCSGSTLGPVRDCPSVPS